MLEVCTGTSLLVILYTVNLCRAHYSSSLPAVAPGVGDYDFYPVDQVSSLYRDTVPSNYMDAMSLLGSRLRPALSKREDSDAGAYMKVLSRHRQKFGKRTAQLAEDEPCDYCRFGKRSSPFTGAVSGNPWYMSKLIQMRQMMPESSNYAQQYPSFQKVALKRSAMPRDESDYAYSKVPLYKAVLNRHNQKIGKRASPETSLPVFDSSVTVPEEQAYRFQKREDDAESCTYCRFGKRSPKSTFQNKNDAPSSESEISEYFKQL